MWRYQHIGGSVYKRPPATVCQWGSQQGWGFLGNWPKCRHSHWACRSLHVPTDSWSEQDDPLFHWRITMWSCSLQKWAPGGPGILDWWPKPLPHHQSQGSWSLELCEAERVRCSVALWLMGANLCTSLSRHPSLPLSFSFSFLMAYTIHICRGYAICHIDSGLIPKNAWINSFFFQILKLLLIHKGSLNMCDLIRILLDF